jgi:hypothetical protein
MYRALALSPSCPLFTSSFPRDCGTCEWSDVLPTKAIPAALAAQRCRFAYFSTTSSSGATGRSSILRRISMPFNPRTWSLWPQSAWTLRCEHARMCRAVFGLFHKRQLPRHLANCFFVCLRPNPNARAVALRKREGTAHLLVLAELRPPLCAISFTSSGELERRAALPGRVREPQPNAGWEDALSGRRSVAHVPRNHGDDHPKFSCPAVKGPGPNGVCEKIIFSAQGTFCSPNKDGTQDWHHLQRMVSLATKSRRLAPNQEP